MAMRLFKDLKPGQPALLWLFGRSRVLEVLGNDGESVFLSDGLTYPYSGGAWRIFLRTKAYSREGGDPMLCKWLFSDLRGGQRFIQDRQLECARMRKGCMEDLNGLIRKRLGLP